MVTLLNKPVPELAPDAEALFREARQRRRRRRLITLAVLVSVACLVAGLIIGFGGGSPPRGAVGHKATNGNPASTGSESGNTHPKAVTSVYSLGLGDSSIVVVGTSLAAVQEPAPRSTRCAEHFVDPTSLEVSSGSTHPCDDPGLRGQSIAVAAFNITVDTAAVKIVRTDPRTHAIHVGPALTTVELDSGSHPVSVYGPGVLWVYEMEASSGPTVWRISTSTGAVLQKIRVVPLVRPILVANDNGLYLVGAGSFGGSDGGLIFHVAPGATNETRVVATAPEPAEGVYASWALSSGDDVWADVCTQGRAATPCELWGFRGPDLTPEYHVADRGLGGSWAVLGSNGDIYSFVQVQSRDYPDLIWEVVEIDPRTGSLTRVRSVRLESSVYLGDGNTVLLGHDLFLLDSNFSRLYRVPLDR